MQNRPYPRKSGQRVWLSRAEQQQLLDVYREEQPDRLLALLLGLCGLRSDEVTSVTRDHFRELDGDNEGYKLVVPGGKTGKRECPVSTEARNVATYYGADTRQGEPLLDVTTKALRDWIADARETLVDETGDERWHQVGMHDLRRTWATDTYYSLAFDGVPIAEQLTMGWGGWRMSASGRETFRENYLGPEPDHIAAKAMDGLAI